MTTNSEECRLCPRQCGVNRAERRGWCGAGDVTRVYRYAPHFGEEPPITGTNGSGTIFFSHCTLRCIYCQNFKWSQDHEGEDCTIERLAEIMRELREKGCHNWNLVSPTPWLRQIRKAAEIAGEPKLPFVYNTSGYERIETLEEFSDISCDIALTDLRYANNATALSASFAADYVERARETLRWFWTHATKTICRVLVLPGHADEAIENLRWIEDNIGTSIEISLMSQYLPLHKAVGNGEWGRRITLEEFESVTAAAEELGLENGWTQPPEDADSSLLGSEMKPGQG